jgi:hypothetical protein
MNGTELLGGGLLISDVVDKFTAKVIVWVDAYLAPKPGFAANNLRPQIVSNLRSQDANKCAGVDVNNPRIPFPLTIGAPRREK